MNQEQKKYQITSQPAIEPITLSEAREHLRNEGLTADDDYLTTLITVSRKWVENYTSRALITQTWKQSWDFVPMCGTFELAMNPVQSISAFTYVDENGDTQNYSTYQTDLQSDVARLVPNVSTTFPSTELGLVNAINITFICGYGDDAEDVPMDIRHAIKILIGYFYDDNRSGVYMDKTIPVPKIVEYLLTNYRLTGI